MQHHLPLTYLIVVTSQLITEITGEKCSVFQHGVNIIQDCTSGCCENSCCEQQQTSPSVIGGVVGGAVLFLFLLILVVCCTRSRCPNRRCCHGNQNAIEQGTPTRESHPLPGPLLVTHPPRFVWNVPRKSNRKQTSQAATTTTTDSSTHKHAASNGSVPVTDMRKKSVFTIWKW